MRVCGARYRPKCTVLTPLGTVYPDRVTSTGSILAVPPSVGNDNLKTEVVQALTQSMQTTCKLPGILTHPGKTVVRPNHSYLLDYISKLFFA